MNNQHPVRPGDVAARVQREPGSLARKQNAGRAAWRAAALSGFFALSSAASLAHAQTGTSAAIDFSDIDSHNYYQGTYSIGWDFTANQDVQVTHLGYYDDFMNGLNSTHLVGIYDMTTQNLVTSATVSPSDPLNGYFRYVALTAPITLLAGRSYAIEGETGLDQYLINLPEISVDPSIAFIGYAGDSGFVLRPHGIAYPDTFVPGANSDFGPNFRLASAESSCGPTSVSLSMYPLTASASQAVLFSAQADISAPFAGAVSFQVDGGSAACTANMDGVTASCTHPLAVGVHSVVARYSGDGRDQPGCSSPATLTIVPDTTQAGTNCALVATPNPAEQGYPVTMVINCTVTGGRASRSSTPRGPNGTTLTGYATLSFGETLIEYVPLVDNAGTYTTSMSGGTFPITATYSGDAANATSSTTLPVVVDAPADDLFYDGLEVVHN